MLFLGVVSKYGKKKAVLGRKRALTRTGKHRRKRGERRNGLRKMWEKKDYGKNTRECEVHRG